MNCVEDATKYERKLAKELNMSQLEKIRESSEIEIHKLTVKERKACKKEMKEIYPKFYHVIGEQRIQKALDLVE